MTARKIAHTMTGVAICVFALSGCNSNSALFGPNDPSEPSVSATGTVPHGIWIAAQTDGSVHKMRYDGSWENLNAYAAAVTLTDYVPFKHGDCTFSAVSTQEFWIAGSAASGTPHHYEELANGAAGLVSRPIIVNSRVVACVDIDVVNGVGSCMEPGIFSVGENGGLYHFDECLNQWEEFPFPQEHRALRVACSQKGSLYIITREHRVLMKEYACSNDSAWHDIASLVPAVDIAADWSHVFIAGENGSAYAAEAGDSAATWTRLTQMDAIGEKTVKVAANGLLSDQGLAVITDKGNAFYFDSDSPDRPLPVPGINNVCDLDFAIYPPR